MVTRFAIIGSPVGHSLSPVLHGAAFAALGLTDYEYGAVDCGPEGASVAGLAALIAGLGEDYRGFSVTMPAKEAALGLADEISSAARAVGSVNTLTRTSASDGWFGDCTDIAGAAAALAELGFSAGAVPAKDLHAVILGAGATARPVAAALAAAGFGSALIASRSEDRAAATIGCARALGLRAQWIPLEADPLAAAAGADVLVTTLPTGVLSEQLLPIAARFPAIFDVSYAPWPSPLAAAASGRVVGGDVMLLNQAFAQSAAFTGREAPRAAMSAALAAALRR